MTDQPGHQTTPHKPGAHWQQDGCDSGWWSADGIGSVRSRVSYGRPGGWWFLPHWLPDDEAHDVGPFTSRTAAMEAAERMAKEEVNV